MNTGKSMIRNLPLIIFIVSIMGCAPATETPQTNVQVTKITEGKLVPGAITQSKTFNQCDSANPIRLQIQFGDNVSETNQDELVLGATITGGADVSGVAKLEIEGSVEKHFASSTSVGSSHQESVDIEIPAYTRQEYTIIWKETRREGTVEYVENGETKSTDYSYRIGLEFSSSSVKNIDCWLPTETPLPATPTPELIVESTPTLRVGTLADNCIFSQTWTPVLVDQNIVAIDSNGCYSMEQFGIFTGEQGSLQIFKRDRKTHEASGVYTPIGNYSVVEFNIYVNAMYIVYSDSPAYVSFAVAPAEVPMSTRDAARFDLHVQTVGKDPFVLFSLADAGEFNGTPLGTQHYEYKRTYTIRFELAGGLMDIFINGFKVNERLAIPTGSKVLYIGYDLPVMASIDVEIKNIQVDGVLK